jgi:hypothetical protein
MLLEMKGVNAPKRIFRNVPVNYEALLVVVPIVAAGPMPNGWPGCSLIETGASLATGSAGT